MAEQQQEPRGRSGYLAALRNRDFAIIWGGQSVSRLGDSIRNIALIWLVKELTGSATAMGVVMIFAMVPRLGLGLIAGALVDLIDRKKAMIASELVRGVVMLLMPFLLWSGHLSFWTICGLAAVLSTASAFFGPAMMSSLPNIVERELLLAANSLNSLTTQVAGILGPALGGVLVATAGTALALSLDGVSFLVSGIAIALAHIPAHQSGVIIDASAIRLLFSNIAQGFRFVVGWPLLLGLILVALMLNFISAPISVIIAVHVDEAWHAGVEGYGLMNSAWSVGVLIGTLLVGALAARISRENLVAGSIMFEALATLGVVFAGNLALGMVFFGFFGLMNPLVNIPLVTWLQETVPDSVRGRVFSVVEVGAGAAQPLSLAAIGIVTDAVGVSPVFIMMAVASFVGGLAFKAMFMRYGDTEPPLAPEGASVSG